MKKIAIVLGLGACLTSCSFLQRHYEEDMAEIRDLEAKEAQESPDGPLFDANGNELGSRPAPSRDGEVARLRTQVSALETKVDVLTASLERVQAERSQPIIQAQPRPQPNMAAPVEMPTEIEEPPQTQISAAPARPLPAAPKKLEKNLNSPAEREFRSAMQLFQNGQNLEAASRFALVAKKYPNHLLAGHALYWAGEANSRGNQMALAGDAWAELEKKYPRSAYMPEALAGLARVYEAQGDSAKAAQYRATLLQSFPKSPIALRQENTAPVARTYRNPVSHSPSVSSSEEDAPLFESEDETGAAAVENQ